LANRIGGPWLSVGKLIEIFTAMGCVLGELPGHTAETDAHRVRYLYNQENDDFVSLSDLDDNDRLPPSEVENWERRLGVTIPKGSSQ
jgi:hypothetical protein